jgi:type VI secretion system VasD/TssJ family lipoprotein
VQNDNLRNKRLIIVKIGILMRGIVFKILKSKIINTIWLHTITVIIATIIMSTFVACSPPPPLDPYVYKASGLQFDIKADQQLNLYDGEAHTLKLAIYQLSENGPFIELQKSAEGTQKLLKLSKFDPVVVGYEQIIVHPNESRIITLDRINQAKWIGIVAGFYSSTNEKYPASLLNIATLSKKKTFVRRALEYVKLLAPSDIQYVPQTAYQIMLTPHTMYETSIFR